MTLMGIDVGTSGCKVMIFDISGTSLAYAYHENSLIIPREGWMELNPREVAENVFECIGECTRQCDGQQVEAIAVSTQGEAVVPVAANGEVLANSILSFDSRSELEALWLGEKIGKEKLMSITGAPLHPMFTVSKLLWIRNYQPEIYFKTWKFMCFGDYISFLLGAPPCIDYAMASRTMLFDVVNKVWSQEIMDVCDMTPDQFSEPVEAGLVIGKIKSKIANELNISDDALIVSGSHDQLCCAVGSGVVKSGMAMDLLGTTESIVCVKDFPTVNDKMLENNLCCYIFPINALYAYLSFLSSSGSIVRWFRDQILHTESP